MIYKLKDFYNKKSLLNKLLQQNKIKFQLLKLISKIK